MFVDVGSAAERGNLPDPAEIFAEEALFLFGHGRFLFADLNFPAFRFVDVFDVGNLAVLTEFDHQQPSFG